MNLTTGPLLDPASLAPATKKNMACTFSERHGARLGRPSVRPFFMDWNPARENPFSPPPKKYHPRRRNRVAADARASGCPIDNNFWISRFPSCDDDDDDNDGRHHPLQVPALQKNRRPHQPQPWPPSDPSLTMPLPPPHQRPRRLAKVSASAQKTCRTGPGDARVSLFRRETHPRSRLPSLLGHGR